jgi:hypothetical protein
MLISDIHIGKRHRKVLGSLQRLADSIKLQGLLHPIGVTAEKELVFGERRLVACRDILGWSEIDIRIVDVTSIAEGEHDENQLRKDFTMSERLAILQTIQRKSVGGNQSHSLGLANAETAAKSAGFRNRQEASRVNYVVTHADPAIIAALDDKKLTVNAAYQIAGAPIQKQPVMLRENLEGQRHHRTKKKRLSQRMRKIQIPWSAKQAATILLRTWPPDLVWDFAEELRTRLGPRSISLMSDGKRHEL